MATAFEGGVSEFQLGHFEGAVRSLEEAAYAAPNDMRVLMWLASAYLQNAQVEAAVSVYRRLQSCPDPRVRRFADNGLRACTQAGFRDSGTFVPPPELGTLATSAPDPPSLLVRMATLSLWDICVGGLRIAAEEWRNFTAVSYGGYLWLVGACGGAALLWWATGALSGQPRGFTLLFEKLARSAPEAWPGVVQQFPVFGLAVLACALLVAWGAGTWLYTLLLVQRWTYYVYVGQTYPFWQSGQNAVGRLRVIGRSLLVWLVLSLIPIAGLQFAQPLFARWGWPGVGAAAALGAVVLIHGMIALTALAVEDIGILRALMRSVRLVRGHLGLVACLALAPMLVWPLVSWTLAGGLAALLPLPGGGAAIAARLLLSLGVYTLAFPLLGTLLGTTYHDLAVCEPVRNVDRGSMLN